MPMEWALRITRRAISPRLAMSRRRIITSALTASHPEDAVAGRATDVVVVDDGKAGAEHLSCIARIDDAVVGHTAGCVQGQRLVLGEVLDAGRDLAVGLLVEREPR